MGTGAAVKVPFLYSQWRLAQRVGVAPWVLEGFPADEPPVEWVIRLVEFNQLEMKASNVKREK